MSENPGQAWQIVIGSGVLAFAGVCVSAFFSRQAVKLKADEKSVEERLALQQAQIADCVTDRERLRKDAQYQTHRIDELNSQVLAMNRDIIGELTQLLKERKR